MGQTWSNRNLRRQYERNERMLAQEIGECEAKNETYAAEINSLKVQISLVYRRHEKHEDKYQELRQRLKITKQHVKHLGTHVYDLKQRQRVLLEIIEILKPRSYERKLAELIRSEKALEIKASESATSLSEFEHQHGIQRRNEILIYNRCENNARGASAIELEDVRSQPNDGMMTLIQISHHDPEFQRIEKRFMKEMQTFGYKKYKKKKTNDQYDLDDTRTARIKKIQKIINPELYIKYRDKRREIEQNRANRPTASNMVPERELWHGTKKNNAHAICQQGFKTEFAGRNGFPNRLGDGIYFACDASYSAQSRFSGADSEGGEGCIFFAKVITGRYCLRGNGCEDSLVDDEQIPMEFCIVYDIQAYPDYLLTFTLVSNDSNTRRKHKVTQNHD